MTLEPGETQTVAFPIRSEQFAFTAIDHRRVVEPGRVILAAGSSSADLRESVTIDLVGPVHHVRSEPTTSRIRPWSDTQLMQHVRRPVHVLRGAS